MRHLNAQSGIRVMTSNAYNPSTRITGPTELARCLLVFINGISLNLEMFDAPISTGGGEFLLIISEHQFGRLALDSATSSGHGRAPALQCRTPSRHHLELQDRRDYTPADRAARTCWLGCPGLLYYLAA
ncbi:hypothetical protein TNCV_2786831 [Trichonephila clavipes]|nr:hypothetical protein TNCV_2786831 [Trichonephila clavipes]